jgi:hypothetical protein
MTEPRRNRVTPTGEIVAIPLRGAWTGNRGNLHEGTTIVRSHRSSLWIICALDYRGRRLAQWEPGRYTLLFFHDEAVAFAAGHRPCALCRRPAYERFRDAWVADHGGDRPSAEGIDRRLHGERLYAGTSRRRFHEVPWPELPVGAFALIDNEPALVLADVVVPWTREGYGRRAPRPRSGDAVAITPPSIMGVLRAGYSPQIDATALRE